ncbi:hypothetical protein MBM_02723 [Drepanopeziza brunnea f. sp. 'multigermtubi' MB_m1]|uniref:FAD-binding PCMH-type domain-containing protein n=1 Tax=Marssonina brunnea f. sp. multigermtubi (strain MB_m1) TaxID=1072389 RepID=K1X2N4_MARBU|nr:uncharacterized protein MBM_02723 [Drepanopeziza brunnea f. sp. 'multigermtubi' MB_m1]EKD19486.1 hypothetical protein MBM_02723 [Drepanopeziza brunnea f. sp. 'multigermtubi' MB_m1]
MVNLDTLKQALTGEASARAWSLGRRLTDTEYSAGFETLSQGSEIETYRHFIIPQLCQQLAPLLSAHERVSVLEIGPGPKSLLGHLPVHLRGKIRRYTAFEPNGLFAARLEKWICDGSEKEGPLSSLDTPFTIHRRPFDLECGPNKGRGAIEEQYDIILFCHSMYGMKHKRKFIEKALGMLSTDGVVVVFHREGILCLDGLVCHRTASYPTGVASVADEDGSLDSFTPFVAARVALAVHADMNCRVCWRKVCRDLGRRDATRPGELFFDSPTIMATFSRHSDKLSELTDQVPTAAEGLLVKSWEARLRRPATIMRPTEISHVQRCVEWALKYDFRLTVLGGGHSGNCLWPNVVSVDMSAFDQMHIFKDDMGCGEAGLKPGAFIMVESGCKTGNVIRRSMAAGLTVPLGARPSVGAGLYLQGGIGHLTKLHGLACDSIVGAIVVSVESAQIMCVGEVPRQYWPVGAVRPDNGADLLWAIRGAGTNFGIVMSVTFKAYEAPTYSVRSWVIPLANDDEARNKLSELEASVVGVLPSSCCTDVYLYWDDKQLHLGVSAFDVVSSDCIPENPKPKPTPQCSFLDSNDNLKTVDSIGIFDADMYVSDLHGGHGSGKTSSFKRCLFLRDIGATNVVTVLVNAIRARPSPLCYLHLLEGGGKARYVDPGTSAFGCRTWTYACVITGVWSRDQDGSTAAQASVRWVYSVAEKLLPLSTGVYGADLGPDPRDAILATKTFGLNLPRLARLKRRFDPHNVLAYACPLPENPIAQKLIILVTGKSCAGKDYCAGVWVEVFKSLCFRAHVVSISDATKREYAAATGADLGRIFSDRDYKEQHRPALTAFFEEQGRRRPRRPEDHFQDLVRGAVDTDVLFITGMRDEAPLVAFSHLVVGSRVLEVRVRASEEIRKARGSSTDETEDTSLHDCPSLVFENEKNTADAVKFFAEKYLLPLVHEDLHRLNQMVRQVPDFPCPGIGFRHVLGIAQKKGGLGLCTSQFQQQFAGEWSEVGAIACCEAGGFIFAPSLASQVKVPLVLIREAGKLPPPTVSESKPSSYISGAESPRGRQIEMEIGVVPKAGSVVVVDDVLSSGRTLCAILQLLARADVEMKRVSIMVVAEFPWHRGRGLLRQRGFGGIRVQSLLVFGDA